jgi:hypothetical protein
MTTKPGAKRTSGQPDRHSFVVEPRTDKLQQRLLLKKSSTQVRRRFLLVSRTGCRRSRIRAADRRAGLRGIIRRSRVSQCGRSGRWLILRRFGGVQFASIIRRLLKAAPVGIGIHRLGEALRTGDLLQQELLALRHGAILIDAWSSRPMRDARFCYRSGDWKGSDTSGPLAVRFRAGHRRACARRRWTTTVGTWCENLRKPPWNPPHWSLDRLGR